MPSSERFKPVIPEYVKYMNDDAFFSAKDLMDIFRYKQKESVHQLVDRGLLPVHDNECGPIKGSRKQNFLWKKSTIMNYIKETWGDL